MFHGNSHLTPQYVIAMFLLSNIVKKCTEDNKFTKSKEKINHLIYMDGVNLFGKNKKELATLIKTMRIYIQDKRIEFGIE